MSCLASPSPPRRVLVIAYECSPRRGSESGAGFSIMSEIAEHALCTVLVGWYDGAELRRWAGERAGCPVEVIEPGESALGRFLFRVHRYPRFVAYLLWLRRIRATISELEARGAFDVAWHLTYSPFWLPTPLRRSSRPTIWGPVTGGDRTPKQLRTILGRKARLLESIDTWATRLFRRIPSVRESHRKVDLVLSSLDRPELRQLRGDRPVWLFPQSIMARPDPEITKAPIDTPEAALYFVSPLRPQKGPHLAVRAAALDERIRLVFAPPPDQEAMQEFRDLVDELGAGERVSFADLTRGEMLQRLRGSKGVVHTAVSDSSSMSLSEALAVGAPVVGLEVAGTSAICQQVTDRRHVRLAAVGSPDAVVARLATLMVEALAEPALPAGSLIDREQLSRRLAAAIETAIDVHEGRHHHRKVAQLFYALQDRGGEVVARALSDGFRDRGFDTVNIGAFRASPMNSSTRDFEILFDRRPSLWASGRCLFEFWRCLRRHRPDVVLLHTDASQILGAPAAALAGVRTRICINHLPLGTYVRPLRLLHTLLASLGLYSDVVFVGESAMRDAQSLPRAYRRKTHLINNAVGVEPGSRVAARRRFEIPEDAFVFLNVGSFTHQKNQATIIDALRDVPGALLVIAGAGDLDADLKGQAAALGERVRFLGRLSPDEMGDVYAVADMFVFPSRYEGRPLALLEAVSAGLPIIASSIPENQEVTADAVAYAPPEDVDAWAALMRQAASDPAFTDDIRRRVKALDVGTADAMVDAYVKLMR